MLPCKKHTFEWGRLLTVRQLLYNVFRTDEGLKAYSYADYHDNQVECFVWWNPVPAGRGRLAAALVSTDGNIRGIAQPFACRPHPSLSILLAALALLSSRRHQLA